MPEQDTAGEMPSMQSPEDAARAARIADQIVLRLHPRRVLDASFVTGSVIEALRERRVETSSMGFSEAINEPLTTKFDLIVCLDVPEDLTDEQARGAIGNLTPATDQLLFSSPLHAGRRPAISWLRLFAEFGLYPDLIFDAGFVAPQAMLFRRGLPSSDETLALFARFVHQRVDAHEREVGIAEEIRALNKRLDEQRETATAQATDLRQVRALQTQFGLAVASLKADLLQSDRRISQIYNSRIWKALVAGGSVIERAFGPARKKARAIPESSRTPVAAPGRVSAGEIVPPGSAAPLSTDGNVVTPNDTVHLKIDSPTPSTPVFLGSVLQVGGWAVAQQGIDRVLVWIEDDGPFEATYGLMREDVRAQYERFVHSAHPGFVWYLSTAALTPGMYRVRVQAVSRAGTTADAAASFQVDGRTQYALWADLNAPAAEELDNLRRECRTFEYQPKISIVTPVFRTPENFLKKCIQSVRQQVYENWELLIVDDGSKSAPLTALLEKIAEEEPRIAIKVLRENAGIAGATNHGIGMATGEYVAFLDHDDEIAPDALFQIVRTLNENRSLDVLYSDEDKIDSNGHFTDGFLKPDWSPDLLGSMNYVCHFLVCRRSLLESVGGLRMGFDGSQDYDLVLRLAERTDRFHRIPMVLYHWRMHAASTAMHTGQKPKASDSGRRALMDHLRRTGAHGDVQEVDACRYRIRYRIEGEPEVSIIIPAGGSEKLNTALRSVLEETNYKNYRIVVIDNSPGNNVEHWVHYFSTGDRRVERLDCRKMPFNFSKLCNRGVEHTASPYVLFLNDDTAVITPDWLEAMLEHAQRPDTGAVGAQLVFPNDTIQHAGVIVGVLGVAAHAFRGLDARAPHYFGLSHAVRNCLAVTAACLLTRREVFDKVGRFDEANLPTCFQDVDLCLRMHTAGYRIVYTPYARLYHCESVTKRAIAEPREIRYMEDRWGAFMNDDPFYNPNLSRQSDAYELDLSGRSFSARTR